VEPEREAVSLTEACEFTLEELAEISGLTEGELREFVEYGAIAPVDRSAVQWRFTGHCVVTMRTASRLRADFELEPHGVALVISLLDRIGELRSELEQVRARLPRAR
jgi:chaperone modulatory protein CbpM